MKRVAAAFAASFVMLFACLASHAGGGAEVQLTPVTLRVDHAPVPVLGADGRMHLVYELTLANLTGARVTIARLDVRDRRDGAVVAAWTAADVGRRLVVRDAAATPGVLGPSQYGIVYLHVAIGPEARVPAELEHVLAVTTGTESSVETAGRVRVAPATDLVIDPPLRGLRFIAGDGCCDSVRHLRATLAIDGDVFTAQRFAIDWERLDEEGRIFVGDPTQPSSYAIYGEPTYAVADAQVVAAVDGMPDSPPGAMPPGMTVDRADGNHVVLDLGQGRHALYAHLKPGSVRVKAGDRVRRGQVLGLVGTSGNSSEPHLHFHVMDGPSPLASNGLPYRVRAFEATRRGESTAAFDRAILDARPMTLEPVPGPASRRSVMPLDLWVVDFP